MERVRCVSKACEEGKRRHHKSATLEQTKKAHLVRHSTDPA